MYPKCVCVCVCVCMHKFLCGVCLTSSSIKNLLHNCFSFCAMVSIFTFRITKTYE
uniref:Uncharacterized protein n=1 Tax=Anguilla anguilla TaxID=7936 RepID=A0A0E9W7V1_ANGAN